MRRLSLVFATLAFATLAHAGRQQKVEVCHVTSGAAGTFGIEVAEAAVDAHLGHGDFLPFTVFADADGDGYGDASAPLDGVCNVPDGYVADDTDCDDTDPGSNPGADEVLGDGIDNDCNTDTIDDACVDVLLHCSVTSAVLTTVCASEGTVYMDAYTTRNASFVRFGDPAATSVLLENTSGDSMEVTGDTNLCSYGGSGGPWNDDLISVTVFVD